MKPVSRSFAISLRIPATVHPALQQNFVRRFHTISDQLPLFWKQISIKSQGCLRVNRFFTYSGDNIETQMEMVLLK